MDNRSPDNKTNAAMQSFREAFKGYNKDDVNAYLEDMNLRFAAVEDDYKKIIYSQKQSIESMQFKIDDSDRQRAELAKIKEQLADRERQLDLNKEKFAEYEKLINALNSKIESNAELISESVGKLQTSTEENSAVIDENAELKERASAQSRTISELNERIDTLVAELAKFTEVGRIPDTEAEKAQPPQPEIASDTEEKAKKYDEMSRQLGNMIIMANSNADKLIADAKAQSEKKLCDAEREAKQTIDAATEESERLKAENKQKLDKLLSAANSRLFLMTDDYVNSYTKYMNEVRQFLKLINGMRSRSGELQGTIDNMRTTIGQELEIEYSRICRETIPDTDKKTDSEAHTDAE